MSSFHRLIQKEELLNKQQVQESRMKNESELPVGALISLCAQTNELENVEAPKIIHLRRISYGLIIPIVGLFGIIGNSLNLVVLTRRNMQGTAYVYMRAHSLASLLAILFCIPFVLRVLVDNERGAWTDRWRAFYHVHLELYLSNGFLGVAVAMLSALTLERHAAVCRRAQGAGRPRPVCGTPKLTAALLALATFLVYLPSCFRAQIRSCASNARGQLVYVYQRRDNTSLLQSSFYQAYRVVLELLFKVGPAILVAALNLRIMLAYRRSCRRRRRMGPTSGGGGARSRREARGLAEERRLMLMLGGSSLLFCLCVSPMIVLNLSLSEDNLSRYSYQVFRSFANLLEITNYSLSFYVYCLFSEDFRRTLARTLECARDYCIGRPHRATAAARTSTHPTRLPLKPAPSTNC